MNHFIAVVGMCGAGKSVVCDELVKRHYHFFRFGQAVLDVVKERGIPPTEENERKIRESLRQEHGMGAMAILNIPKIEIFLKTGNVVGDNMMSWSEYKILKEKYGEKMFVIAVHAPPKLRYDRLAKRKLEANDTALRNRPATLGAARARDFAEIEKIEKGGPIAMADFTIINDGSVEDAVKQLDKILNQISK